MATTLPHAPTQLVRLPRQEHVLLKALAKQLKTTQQDVLSSALRAYRRTSFLLAVNDAYGAMRADEGAWRDWEKEIALWDATSGDGAPAKKRSRSSGRTSPR